jgi:hypothetical protein
MSVAKSKQLEYGNLCCTLHGGNSDYSVRTDALQSWTVQTGSCDFRHLCFSWRIVGGRGDWAAGT